MIGCGFAVLVGMLAANASATEQVVEARPLVEIACTAIPSDGADDTAALRAALDEARKAGRARIVLAPGRYDFFPETRADSAGASVDAHGIEELEIDGGGSEWVIHDWSLGLRVLHCDRVTLRNVTFDWAKAPFVCGEVAAVTDTSFDVAVFEEFPVRGGEKVKAVLEFDPLLRVPTADSVDTQDVVDRTELVAPQRLRVHTNRPVPMTPGRLVALCHMWYGPGALLFEDCKGVHLDNVTLYTAPGMGLRTQRCGDIRLARFRVMIRPDSQRLMSTTADATHFGATTGAIRIEDSLFEGNGDDAANVKAGLYLTVVERVDGQTVRARHRMGLPDPPRPGDRIEVLRPETLLPFAELTVADVAAEEGGVARVVFDAGAPDLRVGDILGNLSTVPRVEIRRCVVRNSRARGFLVQSRGVVIEDCVFEHCTHGGISIITEMAHFCESITSRDVVIRRNRFTEVNTVPGSTFGVIGVIAFLEGYALPPKPGVHRDIIIEDNHIRGTAVAGIYACAAEGLRIRRNAIFDACRTPVRDGERQSIYVVSCGQIAIEENRAVLEEQGAGCDAGLGMGPGCDETGLIVQGNIGFTQDGEDV